MSKIKKYFNAAEALSRLQKYCAYSERCHSDVRGKLIELGVYGDKLELVISQLISVDFLNEQRYAEAYARGKFKMNRWGRKKILQGLKFKRISDYCIRKAMAQIDDEVYLETLTDLLTKRQSNRPNEPLQKTANYLIQKGYESGLVWNTLKDLN